jgi:hypothetical protein
MLDRVSADQDNEVFSTAVFGSLSLPTDEFAGRIAGLVELAGANV